MFCGGEEGVVEFGRGEVGEVVDEELDALEAVLGGGAEFVVQEVQAWTAEGHCRDADFEGHFDDLLGFW